MIFTVVALLFLGSCREADLPTPESENIIGEWEWIESFGGNPGDRITPESTGDEILLEIKENSRFKRFENDRKEFSGKWSIAVSDLESVDFLVDFDDDLKGGNWVTFSGMDTMTLYPESCRDCRTATFVRR